MAIIRSRRCDLSPVLLSWSSDARSAFLSCKHASEHNLSLPHVWSRLGIFKTQLWCQARPFLVAIGMPGLTKLLIIIELYQPYGAAILISGLGLRSLSCICRARPYFRAAIVIVRLGLRMRDHVCRAGQNFIFLHGSARPYRASRALWFIFVLAIYHA